ncbi:MAG TPA: hypothetical protein VM658_18615 [bacterium]|nr:hypothetical protein [bacterium]
MESDDDKKPRGSKATILTTGPFNPEIVAEEQYEFEREFSAIGGLDVTEYFKFYPDYFRDEFQQLYDEKSASDEGQFFKLSLDVPSPLVWLLLNEPKAFLFACEKCIVEFKKKFKEYATGLKQSMHPDEQREIIRIKEEIESYLLDLDLREYQGMLQRQIAVMHLQMSQLGAEEEQEDFKDEFIDPFMKEHNWMFDNNTVKAIETRIKDLFTAVTALFNLLHEKGLFEVMVFDDDHVKF